MILIPSLELMSGRLVRLKGVPVEGVEPTVLGDDPLQTARELRHAGAMFFHVVDLDAVFGRGNNDAVLRKLAEDMIPFQVRGGVRTPERAEEVLAAGADRVVLGAFVYREADTARALVERCGKRVMAAIDVLDGGVQVSSDPDGDRIELGDAVQLLKDIGIDQVVYNGVDSHGEDAPLDLSEIRGLVGDAELRTFVRWTVAEKGQLEELRSLESDGLLGIILNHALDRECLDVREALAVTAG